MFSSEPGAGPWTRFPQVLLASSPGKGYSGAAEPSTQGTFGSRAALPEGPFCRLHTAPGDLCRSCAFLGCWVLHRPCPDLVRKKRKKKKETEVGWRWQRKKPWLCCGTYLSTSSSLIRRTVVMFPPVLFGSLGLIPLRYLEPQESSPFLALGRLSLSHSLASNLPVLL